MIENQNMSISLAVGGPGMFRNELEQYRNSLQNPNSFFILDSIPSQEVSNYIRAADVVIIPSMSEGLPNLAKEAQSCGRPILGTNVGGIPEVVEDKVTGLLIPPNNAEAIADGIKWFYSNQDKMEVMGKNGCVRMKEHFSLDQYKSNLTNFYSSCLKLWA